MRQVITPGKQTTATRQGFFELIFGDESGYLCVAAITKKKQFEEKFFRYPDDIDDILAWIQKRYATRNIYFCPQLLSHKRRTKEVVQPCTVVWADLDTCDPSLVTPTPSVVLQTSPDRWQGYWLLDAPSEPLDAEDAARRIAYRHEAFGADRSGWDLTQLLRIPQTYNFKHEKPYIITIAGSDDDRRYGITEFKALPQVPNFERVDIPMPEKLMEIDPGKVLEKYKGSLDPQVLELYETEPTDDWSASLWFLERLLFESGVTREEVFVVCLHAACNKYKRDNRPPQALWKDVIKASFEDDIEPELASPVPHALMTPDERKVALSYESFVERYIEWAKHRSDAMPQYHVAGAFIILSSLLAGAIKVRTEFGVIKPNLWFMVLGDSTLTRKSTAMHMAMDLLLEVNKDLLLATDGSVEGLLSSIAARPGRPGIFWRDEVSGFLKGIMRKDYLAGMTEHLTQLYDGRSLKRTLRKETIEVRDPILVLLCGGIKQQVQDLIDIDQVLSGFIPRFIFVEGETDLSRFKPLGPASEEADKGRDALLKSLVEIDNSYNIEMTAKIGDQEVKAAAEYPVVLTPEAWARYNKLNQDLLGFAMSSSTPELHTPTMERLSIAGLKAAMLMAGSRQNPEKEEKVVVGIEDILRAIHYVEQWREYSLDIVENTGRSVSEKRIEQVYRIIKQHKDGVMRSRVMQICHLTAREADWVLETLEQRALIKQKRHGPKGKKITPIRGNVIRAKDQR